MFMIRTAKRRLLVGLLLVALSFTMVGARPMQHQTFPAVIPLPNGFQPEGIASASGNTFFVGSIPTGAVYRGDVRSGKGAVFIPAQQGRSAIGMKYDRRNGLLFVAGGQTGFAYIYDGRTGANVAAIQLSTLPSFINDVILTKDAAYFTNSSQPTLHRVALIHHDGLHPASTSDDIPLGGDYKFTAGALNANGIVATPDGSSLIIVNTAEGALYKVDPATGLAKRIDLGTGAVPNGDGLLLLGNILYVVQNQLNQIAVVQLSPDYLSGQIIKTISSPLFHIPTTIARFGDDFYVVNARFDTTPTPDTKYQVVRVPHRK